MYYVYSKFSTFLINVRTNTGDYKQCLSTRNGEEGSNC